MDLRAATAGHPKARALHLFNGSNSSLTLGAEDLVTSGDGLTAGLSEDPVAVAKGDSTVITAT